MTPANGKILVKCNVDQKNTALIGGVTFSTALLWETNYRYRGPTVCEVVHGNNVVKAGDILVCHHNLFYLPSPFHVEHDLFSIPFSKVLFAKIDSKGNLEPICGNILAEEIEVETYLPLPADERTLHKNRYKITNAGFISEYKAGDIVFTRPSTGYNIIYNWDGVQKSVTKLDSSMICGILRKLPNLVQTT